MNAYEPTPTGRSGWFKSTYSDHGNACVEVRFAGEEVLIRDSKYQGDQAQQPTIAVPACAWGQFLAIVAGETNTTAAPGIPDILHDTQSGETTLQDTAGRTLTFTPAEWGAFTSGVRLGEFSPVAA
ncbi:DUF397 domain-containing protein [Nocardia sp. BMG51109]|uniref:DUF397 domain-containing protein n=1 Tax=Nocardia sp. BMG51109 TaxID=1056816 RepID=UPI0004657E03|nr:DUF397 domain-containing protein [Nocardia sp. BMG51109]